MANPSKRRGTQWETDCLRLLKPLFPEANRAPSWGAADKGDLTGTGDFTFECKAVKQHNIAQFIEEAKTESKNAETKHPVVLLKRRNASATKGYAIMEIGDFIDLIRNARK